MTRKKKHPFTHEIFVINLSDKTETVLLSRGVPYLYHRPYVDQWFANEVYHRYPDAKEINDSSRMGYHFEFENLIFELR
jgi:hypothetical protein